MFPMGIRIWDQNRMIYPVKFSVYLDLEKNISAISTLIEGKKYQTFNYMMLTTGIAINGYIYEKDIVMVDGEEEKVGIVEFDRESGAFVVKIKKEKFIINETMEFCEILGNVYEDSYLLDEYKISFADEIFENNFTSFDDTDLEEPIIEEIIIEEKAEEEIKDEAKIEVVEKEQQTEEKTILEETIINEEVVEEVIVKEEIIETVTEEIKVEEEVVVLDEKEEIKEEPLIEEVITEEIIDELPELKEAEETPIEELPEIIEITEISEEEIDANLFMGAEDLPFLDDNDLIDEPFDPIIADEELLEEIEKQEELPPDDIFGDGFVTQVEEKKIEESKEKLISGEEITIYAFGYCAVENGPGTYSYLINSNDKFAKKAAGGLDNTILNRIQLIGVIEALKNIEKCNSIKVFCDSKYVIFPFIKGWIYKWQSNDWKKDSDNKVLNSDLWEEIFNLTKDFNIEWEIVKDVESIKEMRQCSNNAKKEIEKFVK